MRVIAAQTVDTKWCINHQPFILQQKRNMVHTAKPKISYICTLK